RHAEKIETRLDVRPVARQHPNAQMTQPQVRGPYKSSALHCLYTARRTASSYTLRCPLPRTGTSRQWPIISEPSEIHSHQSSQCMHSDKTMHNAPIRTAK